jgi:Serine dehydrogenase proteinase
MATFGEVLREIQDTNYERQREGVSDPVRRKYLEALHRLTCRNVVVYYSAFLQRQGPEHFFSTQINDEDKHGFMATFAGLDFDRGLDLILHTPGGDVAATESIIDYLRNKFGRDIRTIIPQISMSGGTMISLAGRQIIMGSHSNLGPIDPQIGGRPAIAILAEFEKAREDIINNPNNALLWQPILQQYAPTLLSAAQQSIQWTREIGRKTLVEGLFKDQPDAGKNADEIVGFLLSHDLHKAHGRHLHRQELRAQGLEIVDLEDDDRLQDAVLSVHHACMITVGNHNVNKLIENHNGITHAKVVGMGMQMQMPLQIPIQIPGTPPVQPTPIIPHGPSQPAPSPQPGGPPAVPPKVSSSASSQR